MNRKGTKALLLGAAVMMSAAGILGACSGTKKQTEEVTLTRYDAQFLQLFDTVTSLTGYAEDEDTFRGYAEEFKTELAEYHKLYDIYDSYDGMNNIKTINDNAGIRPVEVDRRIIDLIDISKDMYEESNGTFNIAMGSVLSLWHDYRTEGIENPLEAELPPMSDLEKAAGFMDLDKVIIDYEASTIYLEEPQMRLDVGAVAKGYATEQICQKLESEGVKYFMASVGGNVRAIGGKPDGSKWRVGIQNPDKDAQMKYLYRVDLEGMSLVTSGSYERYYTVDGQVYHHIISPDTLMPRNEFKSVSILCRDSGIADVLSTAVFNMPLGEGMDLIEAHEDMEAMWIDAEGVEHFSSGFRDYLVDE